MSFAQLVQWYCIDMEQEHIHDLWADMKGRYFISEGDTVRFLDPVFHEPIEPGHPPRCLLEDPVTALGFSYLRDAGAEGRLTVQLVLAPHGSAADFENALRLHEKVFMEAPAIGIETDWRNKGPGLHPLDHEILLTNGGGRRAFQEAQLSWINRHRKAALPCEYEETSGTPLANELQNMWRMYELATERTDMPPALRNEIRAVATGAYQATRQWAMAGQLGYWLHKINEQTEPAGHSKVPFMLGAWHVPIRQKLSEKFLALPPRYMKYRCRQIRRLMLTLRSA